jgi:hypothetical protein
MFNVGLISTPTKTSLFELAVRVGEKLVPIADPEEAESVWLKVVFGFNVRVYPLVVDTVLFAVNVPSLV